MNEMKMIRPYLVVKVVTMTGLKVYVNVVKVTCSIVKIAVETTGLVAVVNWWK